MGKFFFKDGNLLWIRNLHGSDPQLLKYCLDSSFQEYFNTSVFGAVCRALTFARLKEFPIPLPPFEIQEAIVSEMEAEEALVTSNCDLIDCFERKTQEVILPFWVRMRRRCHTVSWRKWSDSAFLLPATRVLSP